MPIRHRSDFNQALSTLRQLKDKDGRKAVLRLGGTGKDHGGILLTRITTKTYPAPIDQGNLMIGTLIRGMILRIHLLYCKEYTS